MASGKTLSEAMALRNAAMLRRLAPRLATQRWTQRSTRCYAMIPECEETGLPLLGAAARAREVAPQLWSALFERDEPYVVIDDFLGPDAVAAMREDAARLRDVGRFGPSRSVGRDGVAFDKEAVLSCEPEPSDFDDAPHVLVYTRDMLLTLPEQLNGFLEAAGAAQRVSTSAYGTKLAVTLPSGAYPRHVDNACADGSGPADKRWLTVIFYLQDDRWRGGGALRLWVPDGDGPGEPVDVEPVGDRLVCFFSDRIVHEVLPTEDPDALRYAHTLWLVNEGVCDASRPGQATVAAHFPP